MSKGTPVFPDLGYAISRSAVVSVGFSPEHNQNYPNHPLQRYHSHESQHIAYSPNGSPQSQNSTYPPPNYLSQYQPERPVKQPEPARPEFKRRKTFPANPAPPPVKPQGNRRIPRVIAAAAPKAEHKNRPEGNGMQQGVVQGLQRHDPRMMKEVYDELGRQTTPEDQGEKAAGVFGYVFDGTA